MSQLSFPPLMRQISYFAHIAEPKLNRLAELAMPRSFTSGQIIFFEKDESAGLWILEAGRVKAYKLSADGQEYILRFFGPGDTFNDLAALDYGPNSATTMAITDVKARVIPSEIFSAVLRDDHELCLAVLHGLVGRTRELVDQVEDLALRPVTARLARYLLEQGENPASANSAVTRVLIANHLATTPESISRSLRALEKAGAIRFDRHRIIIANLDFLHQQARL